MKKLILLSIVGGMFAIFQNCGTSHEIKQLDLVSLSDEDFFRYPYVTAPTDYVNLQLLREAGGAKRFGKIAFVASIAPAVGTYSGVNFKVFIDNGKGYPVCPTINGSLIQNEHLIKFECFTAGSPDVIHTKLQYTPAGQRSVIVEKDFY